MNILVTGNLGYVGPVLTRCAKEAGHTVIGLDVGYFRDCGSGADAWCSADRQIWRDLRDVRPADVDGVDAVIHLAGLSNDALGELDPRLTHEMNLACTIRLAELAKAAGVARFVFASSCAIYGVAASTAEPLDEKAPLNPISAYASSKAEAEAALDKLADPSFTPVFLRCGTAFGVSQRTRFDLVVNNLIGRASATGVVKVISDGTLWRPILHVEDMSLAALAAVAAPCASVHNQAFNIGRRDANHRILDIAEAVQGAFPGSRLEITGEAGPDPRSYQVDFSKGLDCLPGFHPRWTLEMGIEEVIRFLRTGGLGEQAFDSRSFVRLKQLRYAMEAGLLDSDLRFTAKSES